MSDTLVALTKSSNNFSELIEKVNIDERSEIYIHFDLIYLILISLIKVQKLQK